MALETIGKRSTEYEYDNGGGDNLSKGTKAVHTNLSDELKEDFLEMCERESLSAYQQPNRYFGGAIGNKELAAMTLLGVALYLINGEHAQIVCSVLTSVPPAMFSYRVLNSEETSRQGYHSILFYWTIYGIVALVDQFVGAAQGYSLCKSALLLVFFVHAIRSNVSAIPPSWRRLVDEPTLDLLTTLLSRDEPTLRKISFDPSTPTMTQFSDDDTLEYIFPTNSGVTDVEMDISTACSFLPSLEMQSTQNMSPEDLVAHTTTDTSSTLMPHESISTKTAKSAPKDYETMSALTNTACGGDIVTVPSERVTFSRDERETVIRVTNVSPLHIMFALKTNADTYLIAAPTAGLLFSGQSMAIRVGVTDKHFSECSYPGMSIDKLAIDYTSIPPSISSSFSNFSPAFFYSQPRRRHAIRVFYQ